MSGTTEEAVAIMAAILYTGNPTSQDIHPGRIDAHYETIARQAWDLFDAVNREKEKARELRGTRAEDER
jgi:hypothetical protein